MKLGYLSAMIIALSVNMPVLAGNCLTENEFNELAIGGNAKIVYQEYPDHKGRPAILVTLRAFNEQKLPLLAPWNNGVIPEQETASIAFLDLNDILPILPDTKGAAGSFKNVPSENDLPNGRQYRCTIRINDIESATCRQVIAFRCGHEKETLLHVSEYREHGFRAKFLEALGRSHEQALSDRRNRTFDWH